MRQMRVPTGVPQEATGTKELCTGCSRSMESRYRCLVVSSIWVPKRQVAPEWETIEPVGPPFITEPLTWKQICDRYPNEWVCLVEIDEINDTDFDFRTARVVGHGKTRRAPLEQARPFREQYLEIGHFFTSHD